MRSIRSSLFLAVALLAGGAAASLSAADEAGVRRAAALLDYVARGYSAAVIDGQIVNAAEYEEQQAFAQDAAETLERVAAGRPFAAEARRLETEIRARAPGAETRAASVHARLLAAAGLSTSPPPEVQAVQGQRLYEQACAACHGADGRGDGFAAAALSTKPTDFTGPDRAELTPYRVFSAISWGVPHTAMPSYPDFTDQHRWEIALWTLTFGHDRDLAQRGALIARQRGLTSRAGELVAKSDAELAKDFEEPVIAWVRRVAPFAGPPPNGFPALRSEVALASVAYVHGRWQEAHQRLRDAELSAWLPLEPLVDGPRAREVRDAFAAARAQVAQHAPNPRVLGAVAQLSKALAQGPETLPAQRRNMALRVAWPAALAVCGAAVFGWPRAVVACAAGVAAGWALASRGLWPWLACIGVLLCAAVALVWALARRSGAAAAAGAFLSTLAAAAEVTTSALAIRALFADARLDWADIAAALFVFAASLALAAVVRRAGRLAAMRRPAAPGNAVRIVLACAAATVLLAAGQRAVLARPLRASPPAAE